MEQDACHEESCSGDDCTYTILTCRAAQDAAAALFGARKTWFLCNGSSGGIIASVIAAVQLHSQKQKVWCSDLCLRRPCMCLCVCCRMIMLFKVCLFCQFYFGLEILLPSGLPASCLPLSFSKEAQEELSPCPEPEITWGILPFEVGKKPKRYTAVIHSCTNGFNLLRRSRHKNFSPACRESHPRGLIFPHSSLTFLSPAYLMLSFCRLIPFLCHPFSFS